MAKTPEMNAPAPDIALRGVRLDADEAHYGDYRLSGQRGRPIVLAFYPGDDTAVCTRQMCAYSSGLEEFTGLGATVWGISRQDLGSHERFARKHGLRLPLLADPDGTAVAAYGIGLGGSLRRAVFVIDAGGILRWKHVALVGLTYQNITTLTEQLAALTPDG